MMRLAERLSLCLATLALAACSGLPATSRTGAVHDVLIHEETLVPHELIVHAGDEVRWVNLRTDPVWVYFYQDSLDEIVCARGFAYFWGVEEFAKVEPDQSVSVCLAQVDAVSYRVQRAATVLRGSTAGEGGAETIPPSMHGAILVEAPPKQPERPRHP